MVIENTSLVSSGYINRRLHLFDALQLVLINDSATLYRLQQIFYPLGAVSPDTVELIPIVTVNTILFPYYCDYHAIDPRAFKNSSNHYVRTGITFLYLMTPFQILKQS